MALKDIDHHIAVLQTAMCSLLQLIQNNCGPSLAKDSNADLDFSGLCFSCLHFCRAKGHLVAWTFLQC